MQWFVLLTIVQVNGLPLHGSRHLLTDVLRNWLGQGAAGVGETMLIASDWENVDFIMDSGTAANQMHAGMQAAWAGMDNEMSPPLLAFSLSLSLSLSLSPLSLSVSFSLSYTLSVSLSSTSLH